MSKENWTDDLFVESSAQALPEKVQKFEESNKIEGYSAEEPLTLETGILNLERIVKLLEQKDLPLETALGLFKEGVGLVQYCSKVLDQAEKQMEILLEDQDGQLTVKPASFEVEG